MANIDTELTALMNAVYGEEVRSAFRDALLKMNNDVIGLITREDLYQMTQEEFTALKTSLINQINAAAATARETIPEDYSALSDTVAKLLDASYPNIMWQAGSLSDTGADQSSDYVCRSNYIPVTNILGNDIKSKLNVSVTGDYKVEVYKQLLYDRDKNFIRTVTRNKIYPIGYSTTENVPYGTGTCDGYVRLVAGCVDSDNQPVSHVTYQGSVFTELKESLKVYTTLSWLWEWIEELETDLDEKITDLKADLHQIDSGLNDVSGVFHYDDFAVGALFKTASVITFDSTDKRMVSTPKSICFPVDITIVPADGYRMYIHWTNGRPYSTSNTGWVTSAVTVNANQWFMMTLRKVASDTGYEANAIDFVNKFSVTPSPLRIIEDAVFQKKTMHVSTGGSDETGVGTLANPYATISKAIDMGAEHIIARAGTYNEAISISGGNIHISAYWETFVSGSVTNRPKIIIDGSNTIATALTIENCSNVILEDVVVRNCTNDGALINQCDYVDIQNCEFSNNGRNGITINYSNGVIKDSYGNSNGNDGFNMNYFGDTQFYNCGGHDNGDDGISHHQGTTGCINGGEWYNNVKGGIASPAHGSKVDIYNVYSHDNGYGIYANADADTVARTFHIWNSVLTNNSHYGLTSKRNTAILYNCKIVGNTEGQTTAPSGGSIITL